MTVVSRLAANETAKRIEADYEGCHLRLNILPDVAQRLGLESSRIDEYREAVSARFKDASLRYYVL